VVMEEAVTGLVWENAKLGPSNSNRSMNLVLIGDFFIGFLIR